MPRRNRFLVPMALAVGVLFTCLLVRLLLLRYERGDIYPEYSTMRADPFGTRAFYEALDATSPYKVVRGFASLHRELKTKPDAMLYLGFASSEFKSFSKDEVADLDQYVSNGGRVIITLEPEGPTGRDEDDSKKKAGKKSDDSAKKTTEDNNLPESKAPGPEANPAEPQTQQEKYEREELRREQEDEDHDSDKKKDKPPTEYHKSIAALWGFGVERHQADKKDDASGNETTPPEVFARRTSFSIVEPRVPWKSALYFVRLEPDWSPVYEAKGWPVLIRRHWGQGEILLATDSYFISNEGLRNNRSPVLLSLVAGLPGSLLFDETHLGTQEQEGVMALAEKFRLEGFLYGLFVVVVLLLWRNSIPLVPPLVADRHASLGGAISGKDSKSGLVNLLRRNIPRSEILRVCFTEWKRGVTPNHPHLLARLPEMESIVAGGSTNEPDQIIQSYHDLRHINAPDKVKGTYATKS